MLRTICGALVFLLALTGCSGRATSPVQSRGALEAAGVYSPVFDPGLFAASAPNPYLPLVPGTTRVYEGGSDGERERIQVEVTGETRVILGIPCKVVRDRVWVEGDLVEDTFDWFAEDRDGNVWYFGEDSKEIEGGVVVSTEGSWEAGVDGAEPGIAMLAEPRMGLRYRQEFAPDVAEDMAQVVGLSEPVSIGLGEFEDCLRILESTPLSPGAREFKLYAPGVGLVLELSPAGGNERIELVSPQ